MTLSCKMDLRKYPFDKQVCSILIESCKFFSDVHYANFSMQYTAIFHGGKNVNFQIKMFNIFLIFAQNIDCGYTLEPPQ